LVSRDLGSRSSDGQLITNVVLEYCSNS